MPELMLYNGLLQALVFQANRRPATDCLQPTRIKSQMIKYSINSRLSFKFDLMELALLS